MSFIDKADDVERKQINPTKISIPERWLSLKKKNKNPQPIKHKR